jgi:hypothetical protein
MKSEIRNLKSEASPKAEIRNRFKGGLMFHWASGTSIQEDLRRMLAIVEAEKMRATRMPPPEF